MRARLREIKMEREREREREREIQTDKELVKPCETRSKMSYRIGIFYGAAPAAGYIRIFTLQGGL